jgi:hypothetical protein
MLIRPRNRGCGNHRFPFENPLSIWREGTEETTDFESSQMTGTYTATPAQIVSMTEERIRNFSSRGTSVSRESDEMVDFY